MTNETKKLKRIAIQGGFGAFHEIAARDYFNGEKIEIIPCKTFPEIFDTLNKSEADFAVMAIENMVAGSILQNYTLLRESGSYIKGEIYTRIQQNLMALPGQTIDDIEEVYSHPMAILQSKKFFEQYPHIKLIESIDTALSAKDIREKQLMKVGAIASKLAAEMYELEIIQESIETNKKNQTRFLFFSNKKSAELGKPENGVINKSSLCFEVPHVQGSLSKVLTVLAFYDINLTKIQSMPIIDKEWEYLIYIDLTFDGYERYKQALDAITPLTSKLEILGEYRNGRKKMN